MFPKVTCHENLCSILEFGPLSALFESIFTSHLLPSLVTRQPLSSPVASTIYGSFPASATAVIIVSDFKLKVVEYSTLSLKSKTMMTAVAEVGNDP
jgi:hypothetical protein